jgi:hypothetical protein
LILEVKIPDLARNFELPAMAVKENGDAAFAASPPPSPYALTGESLHPLINFPLQKDQKIIRDQSVECDLTGEGVIIGPAKRRGIYLEA